MSHRLLRDMVGTEVANAVTSGSGREHLDSLDLLLGLEDLADGVIDRTEFAQRFGHRGPHEYELSLPRPGEDPAWVDHQLAWFRSGSRSVRALLKARGERRAQAWDEIASRHRRRLWPAQVLARAWAGAATRRERLRSASLRGHWVLRAFVQRGGAITGDGDDLWFLTLDETLDVLNGDRRALDRVEERRAIFHRFTNLPRYPTIVRGAFDPERWAAISAADGTLHDGADTSHREPLYGWPGAAGIVDGRARVIFDLDDADALEPGEILVTPLTNVGWTPVFLHAAAVVTDIGAPLSHAAIVGRELGIPAVVGCRDATTHIHTGDKIRVDGERGVIEWLEQIGDSSERT